MRRGLNRTVLAGQIVVLVACGLGGASLAAQEVRVVGKWESYEDMEELLREFFRQSGRWRTIRYSKRLCGGRRRFLG